MRNVFSGVGMDGGGGVERLEIKRRQVQLEIRAQDEKLRELNSVRRAQEEQHARKIRVFNEICTRLRSLKALNMIPAEKLERAWALKEKLARENADIKTVKDSIAALESEIKSKLQAVLAFKNKDELLAHKVRDFEVRRLTALERREAEETAESAAVRREVNEVSDADTIKSDPARAAAATADTAAGEIPFDISGTGPNRDLGGGQRTSGGFEQGSAGQQSAFAGDAPSPPAALERPCLRRFQNGIEALQAWNLKDRSELEVIYNSKFGSRFNVRVSCDAQARVTVEVTPLDPRASVSVHRAKREIAEALRERGIKFSRLNFPEYRRGSEA